MKANLKITNSPQPAFSLKNAGSSSATALAISKKLLEIKRISGAGEMTELNLALFRHLK
jgi:hypothetical protein